MKASEWFKTRRITDATWAIDDQGCDTMYLISGDERSLLLDTGWGIGNLKTLIGSLSRLPLIVVNSHGHPDHTFGNSLFPQVHIHEADERFIRDAPSLESRAWIVRNILPKPLPEDFNLEKWFTSVPSLKTFKDGYVFDLGDRTLRVISVPGHTPGSICLIDRKDRLLFTGDTVLQGPIWLHLEESVPLSQFHKSLQRLQGFTREFDCTLPAHADLKALPLSKRLIDELAAGVKQILEGKLVGKEEKTFAGDGLRCDFDSVGVVYRPDHL